MTHPTQTNGGEVYPDHHALFGVFYRVHKTRDLKLALCADGEGFRKEWEARALEQVVTAERLKGGLSPFRSVGNS